MKQANNDDADESMPGHQPEHLSLSLSDSQQRAFTALREVTLSILKDVGPYHSDDVYERTARQLRVNRSSLASVAAMFPSLIHRRGDKGRGRVPSKDWDPCAAYWMTKRYRLTMVEKLSEWD